MTPSFGFLLAVLLHPVHETVSEVEWNSETNRLEVALRLNVLDEQWIRQRSRKQKKIADWAIEYLESRLQIDCQPHDNDSCKPVPGRYHWVGRQQQGSHVWWYFEIEPGKNDRPTRICQRMLFDRNEQYLHRVVVLGKKTRRAVTLTVSNPHATMDFDADSKITIDKQAIRTR